MLIRVLAYPTIYTMNYIEEKNYWVKTLCKKYL